MKAKLIEADDNEQFPVYKMEFFAIPIEQESEDELWKEVFIDVTRTPAIELEKKWKSKFHITRKKQ